MVLVSRLLENAAKDIASTRRLSLISVLFALKGKQLRASASNISLPGWYIMTMSYCCNFNNIFCNLTGAEIKFFKQIISNGLWSLSTTNNLLYRYIWNFSHPNTMANSSRLMFVHLVSVSIKLLLAKAYRLVRCRLLDLLMMHHTVKSLVYFCHNSRNILSDEFSSKPFILWKLLFTFWSHANVFSFFSRTHSSSVWWLRCSTNICR